MAEKSGWYNAFGPGYLNEGLRRRGIEDTIGLISISTADASQFYPQKQFDIEPNEGLDAGEVLLPRAEVIKFYGDIIKPAIEEKIIDEYTITAWLFTVSPPRVSVAEAINNNPANADYFKQYLGDWFGRLRQ